MTAPLLAVAFGARDPDRLADFWAEVLGRDAVTDGDGVLLPGDDTQVGLRFARVDAPASGPRRMHLHVTSESSDQESVVAGALRSGASHLDVGQLPDEDHVVLADPEGNAFCVIPPDSRFLAGCGTLGEVACEGTRAVGVFWSRALGWPLVWDEDEETAVQSPHGGTKVAWGGPPVPPPTSPAREWFELTCAYPDDEPARLVSLGATRHSDAQDGYAVLTDPDGAEVRLRPDQE